LLPEWGKKEKKSEALDLRCYFLRGGNVSSVFTGVVGSIFVPSESFSLEREVAVAPEVLRKWWLPDAAKSCIRDRTVAEGSHTALWNICWLSLSSSIPEHDMV
jgi:hypothetical protein